MDGRSNKDVWDAVALIRTESLDNLRNSAYMEHDLLPRLGLNAEYPAEFPEHLLKYCGHGLRSWQYPAQFAKYLVTLSHLSVRSYGEIGTRHGGTFIITVEYLRRFNTLEAALGVDPFRSPILTDYVANVEGCRYLEETSTSLAFHRELSARSWDLVLVDGDHSEDACRTDYRLAKDLSRMVALHDIASPRACPGVVSTWHAITHILPRRKTMAFVDQYQDVVARTGTSFLGIGLALLG